jgi:membrane associated rhomboid family serine protease
MDCQQFKDVPVSLFLAVSIVVIFALYVTAIIKTVPCGKNVLSMCCSNFVHIETYHLMANLLALYAITRVERDIGPKRFASLILFLIIFTSVIEVIVHKIFVGFPCSVGFSGILFGIMTWELITKKGLNLIIILSIIGIVAMPSVQNSKVSLIGHAVGAITGVIGGLLWKYFAFE